MDPRADPGLGEDELANNNAASLTNIGLRRPAASSAQKDGDITSMLAAMPASPEVLSDYDSIEVPPVAGMRDVTPDPEQWQDAVEWWNALRQGQPMPAREQLKTSDLVSLWPNMVLFRCGSVPGQLQPDSAFSTALRANRGGGDTGLPGGAEVTAMLSQWMIRLANKALATKAPVSDESNFDTARGKISYRLVALPFGLEHRPDHILCQVETT